MADFGGQLVIMRDKVLAAHNAKVQHDIVDRAGQLTICRFRVLGALNANVQHDVVDRIGQIRGFARRKL